MSKKKGQKTMHKSSAYEKRRKRIRQAEIVIAIFICVAMVLAFAASMV